MFFQKIFAPPPQKKKIAEFFSWNAVHAYCAWYFLHMKNKAILMNYDPFPIADLYSNASDCWQALSILMVLMIHRIQFPLILMIMMMILTKRHSYWSTRDLQGDGTPLKEKLEAKIQTVGGERSICQIFYEYSVRKQNVEKFWRFPWPFY